jgi:hypothetical protein
MSCRAVVVTTDAPPMNEIVDATRGVLCAWSGSTPQRLGTRFEVDPAALEAGVPHALSLDAAARRAVGERARAWYLENDRVVRDAIVDAVRELST